MALSVNVPTESFESAKDDVDLEDGEIEDDEEEGVKTTPAAVVAPPVVEKVVTPPPKRPSPQKLEPPIIEASAVASAKLLVAKNKEPRVPREEKRGRETKKHSKKHSKRAETEDDWADNVERAIRRAMGKESGVPADVKSSREESSRRPADLGTEDDRNAEVSGDDRKSKKKKRKKKHRDEDGEDRKESKRRKKHHHKEDVNEDREDDDEMLFVRGASPINLYRSEKRRSSQSPSSGYRDDYLYPEDVGGQLDELYDSFEDDSELDEFMQEIEGTRGRGRGLKRGRGRGGIMRGMRGKGLRPRDLLTLKKRKRPLQPRHPDQRPDSVCMFFMQGKCQKGDDCPYSHDAQPPRKMELCKFYLMDCCAKKDKCLYMHHDFPCKFHHTGLKCYAGDRCKFSHGPLNDVLKNILLRHLETAPKEILGDFPRLSREGAAAMVHNKKSRDHTSISATAAGSKSIPSLFDIEVPVPTQFLDENEDGSPTHKTTPMPSDNEDQDVNNENASTPPKQESPSLGRRKNRWDTSDEPMAKSRHLESKAHWDEEIRKHQEQLGGGDGGDGGRRRERDEGRQFDDGGEKKKRRSERERKSRWEEDREEREPFGRRREDDRRRWESDDRRRKRSMRDMGPGGYPEGEDYEEEPSYSRKSTMRFYRDEDHKIHRSSGLSSSRGSRSQSDMPRPPDLDTDAEDKDELVMDVEDRDAMGRKESVDETALVIDDEDEDGREREAPTIPLHIQKLPKKQQELFLRIQQQQREQESNQSSSVMADEDEERHDERWYSSDEDETGESTLSDVLKKLSASTKAPDPDPDLAQKFTDLTKVPDVSDAVNKLLTSIGMCKTDRPKASSTLPSLPLPPVAPQQSSTQGPRDPRLSSRDPRNRQESSETRTSQDSPTASFSSMSSLRADPRARRRSTGGRSIYDSISLSGPDTTAGQGAASVVSPLASGLLTGKTGQDGNSDVDLRRMLGGFPFKPVPKHTAATEIDAGLNSHPPIPYRVSLITVPTPDYTRLKVSSTDPLVRVDPRLRKLFKISISNSPASPPPTTPTLASPTSTGVPVRADPRRLASQSRSTVAENFEQAQAFQQRHPGDVITGGGNPPSQQGPFARNELLANPVLLQQMLPTMGLQNPQMMPNAQGMQNPQVMQNAQGMVPVKNVDPRMFRNAPQTPGLLGDAPFYPNAPRYDEVEHDTGNGSDSDQRPFYQGNKMQEWDQQPMMDDHVYRNPGRGGWRGHPRRMNPRYQYDKRNSGRGGRSYTPPPM